MQCPLANQRSALGRQARHAPLHPSVALPRVNGKATVPRQHSRAAPFVPHAAATLTADAPAAGSKLSDILMWKGVGGADLRLQTQVLDLAEDTLAIRSLDWDRPRFDIEFSLELGTTYNSYLIMGEKTALVDASHEKFNPLYLQTLKAELDARGRKVDYIIVSHTEPDHSGLIPAVLAMYPDAVVAGSKVALTFLKGLTHGPFTEKAVKGGDRIDLGNGHDLEFCMAPNLHWPDTMFSYDHKTGVMYTCDAFGSHYCTADAFDVDLPAMLPHYSFYYDCLMKPNAKSVTTALRKIKDLNWAPTTIANGHGPILRYNLTELVDNYQKWSTSVGSQTASVAVLYASDYGYSDRLSQTLAKGITKAGVPTDMIDMLSADPAEVVHLVGRSAGVVVMCPDASSADAKRTLAAVASALKPGTKLIIAESFGGNDEPIDTLQSSLVDVGAEVVVDALRVKDSPTQALYQAFEEAGTDLAQALTVKESMARKKAAMPADIAKGIARISSGLYIVTAAQGEARSAMVASWVSQASFEPLGLMVSVAKDRAIESLLQQGDTFVLNVLGEDAYGPVMKHFLQRFAPGADRFAGIDWFPASNGSPALKDAIAYLECRVARRHDAGDHWLVYCEAAEGRVAQPAARTAVHRRKVANYY